MNVLEQLRSDMDDAGCEADVQDENVVDACLAVLDEFIAGHEVVEVFDVRHTGEPADHWLAMPDSTQHEPDFVWGDKEVVTPLTIIVPRKQKPTLLEAVKDVSLFLRTTSYWRGMPKSLHRKVDAMDAAVEREERDE